MKRIRESINKKEYDLLIRATKGNEKIRANTKSNLLRSFTLLYYTGLRVNELQELRIKNIQELLTKGSTKVELSKTQSERKLHLTPDFKRDLLKVFDLEEPSHHRVITKGANKNKVEGIHEITFIGLINTHLKEILGDGYTSHSFRQGIITEYATRSIDTNIIKEFIAHKNVKTTMKYIKPTEQDVVNSLIR
jgi:integrase/recombinase XerD